MNPIDARLAELAAAGRRRGPQGSNVGELALELTEREPDRLVIRDGQRSLTRGELVDAALRLGGALRERGLRRGAILAFQLPNWWEACVINLCAALFGYRVVPLLTIYRRAELAIIVAECGVDALFVPGEFRGQDFPALIASLPAPPEHLFLVRAGGGDGFGMLLQAAPGDPDPAASDDAKMVIFTSGSSGRPKGVIHTHDSIDALIRRTAAFWGTSESDRLYVPSPIAHVGGGLYAFEFPWIAGCEAYLEEVWEPTQAVARIESEALTFMAGATPFLAELLDAAEQVDSRLPSLRRFICGGASVPPELVRRGLARFSSTVVSRAYGSSEVPLVCPGASTRAEAEAHADTDGECTVELQLLSDDGTEVAEGEITVRAPQMFLGYLDPDDDAGCFTADGRFRMGDLGRVVDGRFVVITGRKKDIIIRKGENISPLEIEGALLSHPAVAACAVVGRPDAERGEMVVAYVVPKEGAEFGFAQMTAHLDGLGLARQKFPEDLRLVGELPVNSVGKVQKDALRKLAAGGRG